MVGAFGGCRVLQSLVEGLSRLQEMNSQWEGIPIGNGPRKNEYLKTSVPIGIPNPGVFL